MQNTVSLIEELQEKIWMEMPLNAYERGLHGLLVEFTFAAGLVSIDVQLCKDSILVKDKYGFMVCIPYEHDTLLEYIKMLDKFMDNDNMSIVEGFDQ